MDKTLKTLGWPVILVGMLASCSSAATAPSSVAPAPEESANKAVTVQKQPTVVGSSEQITLIADQPSAVPEMRNKQAELDPEVAALRDEALENAIAEGNLTTLTSHCHMGTCIESYYTFTTLTRQVDSEQLYSTELVTFTVQMDGTEPGRWNFQPDTTLVLCSTQRPLVIYSEKDGYRLDHISPAAYPPGFGLESHSLYWAICHDIDNVLEIPQEVTARRASELGYDPQREAQQTTTPFLELFEG